MPAQRCNHPVYDVAAADPVNPAGGHEDGHEVGIERARTPHVDPQVGMDAPPLGRHQPAEAAHLVEVELAYPDGIPGIEAGEPGAETVKALDMPIDVADVLPAFT